MAQKRKSVAPTPEPSTKRFRTRSERSATVPPETMPGSPAESSVDSSVESSDESPIMSPIGSPKKATESKSKKSTASKKSIASKNSTASSKASKKSAATSKSSKISTALRTTTKKAAAATTPAPGKQIEGVFSRAKTLAKDGLKYPPDFAVASKKAQRRIVTNHLTPTDQARAARKAQKAAGTTVTKTGKGSGTADDNDDAGAGGDSEDDNTPTPATRKKGSSAAKDANDDDSTESDSDDDKDKRPIGKNGRRPRRTEAQLLVMYARQLPSIGKLRYSSKVTRSGKRFGGPFKSA
ncbi:hypothetical protein Dda_1732 [Drechslerella dactyloides]|uniref:Uncharacterized protein n=1 Tax=Drechslerella dactyloides TaxID=74499 RepID=A0AAD6NKW5_DREDA|nr:hypothetical protein Dda_1732 [Drechslerella dactyloides]